MTLYQVKMIASLFETKEEAKAFMSALNEAFCNMPEAEGISALFMTEEMSEEEE